MPVIHTVATRSLGSGSESTQSLLQHSYFIAAFVILIAFVILRIIILRRRNQALSNFFRIGGRGSYSYGSYPPNDTDYRAMYHGIQLARPPAAYQPAQRIRAADTDANGRRLAGEDWDGKDTLPAYTNIDRPPKYVEDGWPSGGPPQPVEQSAVTSEGEHAHPNTTDDAPEDNVDRPTDDSHNTSETEAAVPPPTHHDLSSS